MSVTEGQDVTIGHLRQMLENIENALYDQNLDQLCYTRGVIREFRNSLTLTQPDEQVIGFVSETYLMKNRIPPVGPCR